MIGIAAQHEANAAFPGALGGLRDALCQECVMPQVRVRIERHRREEDHYRLFQTIGRLDCYVERGVVEGALGTLHPVHDTTAGGIQRSGATYGYPWIGRQLFQAGHRSLPLQVSDESGGGLRLLSRHEVCLGYKIMGRFLTAMNINPVAPSERGLRFARRQDFIGHRRRLHRRLHVVDTHDVRSAQNAGNHRGQRPVETLGTVVRLRLSASRAYARRTICAKSRPAAEIPSGATGRSAPAAGSSLRSSCQSRNPGRARCARAGLRARRRLAPGSPCRAPIVATMSDSCGRSRHWCGWPRVCISTTPHCNSAQVPAICGSH